MQRDPNLLMQQLPPGIWDALQCPNTDRLSRLLSDFPNGIADVTDTEGREGVLVNKFDLLCPKVNCGSVILKNGVGLWVERSSIQASSYFLFFDTIPTRLLATTSGSPDPSRPSASPSSTRNHSMVVNHWITHGVREYWVHTSRPTPYKFRYIPLLIKYLMKLSHNDMVIHSIQGGGSNFSHVLSAILAH